MHSSKSSSASTSRRVSTTVPFVTPPPCLVQIRLIQLNQMNASIESAQEGAPWLLLIHQVPPKPDYLRVKVRRRLHRLNAFPLKRSVYVLPNTASAREDFEWLAREIVADGGEATVCEARFVAPASA